MRDSSKQMASGMGQGTPAEAPTIEEVEPQGKREGHSRGRMEDVSTAVKWGTSQTTAPNQRKGLIICSRHAGA